MPVREDLLTRSVQCAVKVDPLTGAINTPVYLTSTYKQSAPGVHQGYDYSRGGNPTRNSLEKSLADLEGAQFGLSFSSGLAAEQAIIHTLDPGSKVLVSDDVYGGTGRLFRSLYQKYQIDFQFIDMTDDKLLDKYLTKEIDMVWIETPTNPTLKILDIQKMASLCKEAKALCVVDNTFCSPLFQSPLELGADLVVHSLTKYIGGHCDLIGGAVMTDSKKLYEKLAFNQMAIGAIPSPYDCFLISRSIKTLGVRMAQHEKSALEVAKYLSKHEKCKNVLYPGLETHPQYELARKQMKGFSGMISFEIKGDYQNVTQFLSGLKIVLLAESLGGVETLINHPEKMTHASVPEGDRKKLGINANLLRLSVGIESSQDLIKDLKQSLEQI